MGDLEERLRSHAQAFDGLLSLIPAKFYYAEDGSEQWKRKKQTKEQARDAKRAKLDPDAAKTAKDVMDENARKRKREEQQDGAESSDGGELGSEVPKEGLKRGDALSKKQKPSQACTNPDDAAATKAEEAEARKKLKEEKKAQKKQNQKEKKKVKDTAKKGKQEDKGTDETKNAAPDAAASKSNSKAAKKLHGQAPSSKAEDSDEIDGEENPVAEGLSLEFDEVDHSSTSSPNSPDFDTSNPQSGSSSISSIVPPSAPTDATKTSSSEPKPLKPTPDELRQRLQKRLDDLRAARQADGLNGKPARNRQELIEARRQKAEQRKAHKKELRQKARDEEQRENDEAMARRFSPGGSGSLLASPRSPADSVGSGNYAFGRVIFSDGQIADPTLTDVREKPKTNGPRDPASALKVAEAKKARLAGLDEEKRADIEAKDMWLNAKKRAHGERIRDDTSLLKKALKRKESAKKRSEREWKERLETVQKGKDMKQQKREDNLRKRREGKGVKSGGKKSGGAGGGTKGKGKPRPGFEGSFKAKVGGGGKKK
ncbi:surfeit locus protein 6-domain-containing protein [Aspergillus cavernicola]|uniref:Surfeit locus protein 6-domain-containing protein n=1 Tax=Aspergillus cavernicola TaxID=176166 RepID=A0ABR4IPB3_9EURO